MYSLGRISVVTATANKVPYIVGKANFRMGLCLLYTEDSHLAPSNPWQLHAFGWHLQNHFSLQSLPESRVEHPMSALNWSWRKSTIRHLLVNCLDVQLPDSNVLLQIRDFTVLSH
jgi:hypothetical protein